MSLKVHLKISIKDLDIFMKISSVVLVKINMTTGSRNVILFVHYCTVVGDTFELVSL